MTFIDRNSASLIPHQIDFYKRLIIRKTAELTTIRDNWVAAREKVTHLNYALQSDQSTLASLNNRILYPLPHSVETTLLIQKLEASIKELRSEIDTAQDRSAQLYREYILVQSGVQEGREFFGI